MAVATASLVAALRATALRLRSQQATYRWSSFIDCNCGHLAQTLTGLSSAELRERVPSAGVWQEEAEAAAARGGFPDFDYGDRPALDEGAWEPENVGACTVTGTPLDEVFAQLAEHGLTAEDVAHLERLSDPRVRRELGTQCVDYPQNDRGNVIAYMETWANLLERELGEPPAASAVELADDLPQAAE